MPKVFTEVVDTYESITRPVALAITRQLAAILNLPSSIRILYPGASEEAAMTGSTLNFEPDPTRFKYDGRISIEVTENVVDDRVLTTAIFRKENQPVFLDNKLKVRIAPVYSGTEMVFTVVYRAPNRVLAKRFRDDALMHTSLLRKENLHELVYNYSFPKNYLLLLEEIHRMREAVAGYGEDFSTWVRNHITGRATNITTLIGTEQMLAIAENQISPLGWFDFTAIPEAETKENEGGAWNVSFEYRLIYDKVIGVTAEWPLVVHNQLVDTLLRCTPEASGTLVSPERRTRSPSLSRFAFDNFTKTPRGDFISRQLGGFVVPEYDDWIPATVHPRTSTLGTLMLMVDELDPTAILDLHDLGDYTFSPEMLDFLVGESPYLSMYGESILFLTLYREEEPIEDKSLLVDLNLMVRSKNPLNLRERYHLRISLINDLTILSLAAKERLRTSGLIGLELLTYLQCNAIGNKIVPPLLGGKVIPMAALDKIGQRINDLRRSHQGGIEYRLKTVANLSIVAHRSIDYAYNDTQTHSSAEDNLTTVACDGGTV